MSETIAVELAARRYDIHVGAGLLLHAGALLAPLSRGPFPIVTDTNVAAAHLEPLIASLHAKGLDARPIIIEPGEGSKSFDGLEKLCANLLRMGIDRSGIVVALGGGVVGDLTGFAAAILKRGIDFVQIPTTLLAQVDSSVGGKTAINVAEGKNLIGVFHQPRLVIADIDVLGSLPRRELLAGYAEVVKYGALGDIEFFSWLEKNAANALHNDREALTKIVAHSCQMKADIVARDERETGERALLNLGHTFGHALEAATGYSQRLLHGEGVAIGMGLAMRLSAKLGFASEDDAVRLETHLRTVGLPSTIADISGPRPDVQTLIGHMQHDKKVKSGQMTFVLARGLGQAFTTSDVPLDAVTAVLAA